MMEEIVVAEDDARRLEKRFGPEVRLMGAWSSDGTFGYASVPLSAVWKAAHELVNPELIMALSRLARMPARTTSFLEILNTIGSPLIAQIVATYRESSSEGMSSGRAPEPRALARTAAG